MVGIIIKNSSIYEMPILNGLIKKLASIKNKWKIMKMKRIQKNLFLNP